MRGSRKQAIGKGIWIAIAAAALLGGPLLIGFAWAEIPAGPDVPTHRDYAAQEAAFFTRIVLEPYLAKRAGGAAQAADDDAGEQFLRLWIDDVTKRFDDVDVTPLALKGKLAIEAGIRDPVVAYCYGQVLRYQGSLEESAKHLQFALDNLESGGYDVSLCAWSASHLTFVLRDLHRLDDTKPVAAREVDYLTRAVADGPYESEEQRLLYQHINWVLENYPIEAVENIVAAINSNYPWLSHMASGIVENRRAWKARGGGWASEVSEEGWKRFAEHMDTAQQHFHEAWAMNPNWPEAATKLIAVAMAGNAPAGETPRLWFDRAVEAQLDYRPAYSALFWALMPRWGGSHQELYATCQECLETGRYDTHVPYCFLEGFESIARDIGSTADIYQRPGVYEDFLTMADGYLAEPKMERHHYWYRTLKVSVAARCGKWEDARRHLLALNHEPHENAFTRLGLKMDEVIGEIYARSGDVGKLHADAEQLAEAGNYLEAKARYVELVTKTADQPRVTKYFQDRVRDVAFDESYFAEKWTPLPLDPQLSGWRILSGKWSVDDQGRLVGEAHSDGLSLMFEKRLGTRFELRGKATFLSMERRPCNIGIFFGQENGQLPNSFRWYVHDDYAAVFNHDNPLERKDIAVEENSTFRIERWDNAISAYLNDELIAEDVEIEPYGPPSTEVIGLGGRYWYHGPIIHFEGIEIRKLKERSGVAAAEDAAVEAPEKEPEEQEPADEEDSSA